MAAQTRLWRELPYTQATLGPEETRECRSGAILDGRHLRATFPFVAHCNCIGFLDSARPGYRPHLPLSTKRGSRSRRAIMKGLSLLFQNYGNPELASIVIAVMVLFAVMNVAIFLILG